METKLSQLPDLDPNVSPDEPAKKDELPPGPSRPTEAGPFSAGDWLAVFEPPKYFKICQVIESANSSEAQLHVVRFQPDSQPPDTYIKLNDGVIEVRNIICRTHLVGLRHGRYRLPVDEKVKIVAEMQRLDPALLAEISKTFEAMSAAGALPSALAAAAAGDRKDRPDAPSPNKTGPSPKPQAPKAKPTKAKPSDKDSDAASVKSDNASDDDSSIQPSQAKKRKVVKAEPGSKPGPAPRKTANVKPAEPQSQALSPSQLASDPRKTLRDSLEILGLTQYYDVLVEEGYDDLRFIPGIVKEEDLIKIGFKRGHAQRFLRSLKPV